MAESDPNKSADGDSRIAKTTKSVWKMDLGITAKNRQFS